MATVLSHSLGDLASMIKNWDVGFAETVTKFQTVLKATPVDDRRELVKKNKLCFNCLSSNHMISQCWSKHSPKVSRCNKCNHILLHREIFTKNFVTSTKNDANTPTPITHE